MNKMKRSRSEDNPLKSSVALPGDSGVFNANPAPGFREYPASATKVLPETKFADTEGADGLGGARRKNTMSRVTEPSIVEEMGIKTPGTTTIIKTSNKMNRSVKSKNTV